MNTLKQNLYQALYNHYQAKKDKAMFQLNLSWSYHIVPIKFNYTFHL